MVEKLKKWQSDYNKWLEDNPEANELEWRVSLRNQLFIKGLGYHESQVKYERERTDLRIFGENLIPYFVVETKISDKSIDAKQTLSQALKYLDGGEQFVVLASKKRIKIFDPFGIYLAEFDILEPAISENPFFQIIHCDRLRDRENLVVFREGKLKGGFLKVDAKNEENLDKLIAKLRYCSGRLIKYVALAFEKYKDEHAEFKKQLDQLDKAFGSIQKNGVKPYYYERKERQYIQTRQRLEKKYRVAREIFDNSFKIFSHFQPFSKSPSTDPKKREQEIKEIYFTDVAYAALNRILFIRIAEDKKLVNKKISNSGVHAWRNFTTFIKDKYQELLRVAFRDTGELYAHFFEANIFDWYIDSDGDLNSLLEEIFYILNSFDFSKIDSNSLADLYQEYLPAEKRKRLGEFYTPPEVAEYILKSVGYPDDGRLLDFACGSGGFLVPAARMRLRQLEEKGVSPDLQLEALQDIVGLDINPFATHIAEMNMLFVILETYLSAKEVNPKFELKRIPIYTTDSLVSVPPAGITMEIFQREKAEEFSQSLEIIDDPGSFKWVVGNPPYVRNERLPEEYRELYKNAFLDVAKGNPDLYTYFLRKGIDYLDDNGRMGIIVSLGIADSGASEKIRQYLSQYHIEKIVSLESAEVFEASTNPIIIIIKKAPTSKRSKINLVNDITSLKDLAKSRPIDEIEQERWLGLTKESDNSWRVEIRAEDLVILEKLLKGEKIFEASYGMTLRDKAEGRKMISTNKDELENPVPLLDGREVRNWTVSWQGRYLEYKEELISSYLSPDFFDLPVIVVPRISKSLQAALIKDDKNSPFDKFACRDTIMIVRSINDLVMSYENLISLLNNNLSRFFAAMISRAGVVQEYYSTFYPRVINNICISKDIVMKDLAVDFKKLQVSIHDYANKIQHGDALIAKEIDKLFDTKCRPFGLLNGSDLSGYVSPLKTESSEINKSGDLICKENLGVIKGDPDVLQFILSYSQLKEMGELSKNHLEKFLIPENRNILLKALEKMESWFDEKPGLLDKLEEKEEELDEIIFDNTKSLTKKDIIYIKRRIKSHPLDKIIVTTPPGVATKRIPHKRWMSGERYKE